MAKVIAKKSKSLPASIKTLEEILTKNQSPVDIKKFAYLFMEKIGGPAGFVNMVMKEYNDAETGSLAKSRVLDIMMKLFQLATPKEAFGDYGDLSDDDLKDAMKSQMGPTPPQWVTHVCI